MDNDSLKGSPMHMAHHMVKAYGINEDCTYFAIAEPAFYGKIKQQQRDGRPKKQNIWNTPTVTVPLIEALDFWLPPKNSYCIDFFMWIFLGHFSKGN